MRVVARVLGAGQARLDHGQLVGTWHNIDRKASGIRRVCLTAGNAGLRLRVFGAGRTEPFDWGDVDAQGFAARPTCCDAWAFTAAYDIGFRSMQISAYTRGGLLVVTTYNAFSGVGWPQPYWTREFFRREPGSAPRPGARGGRSAGGDPRAGSWNDIDAQTSAWGDINAHDGGWGDAENHADRATAPLLPWQLDPAPLVGTWRNVDPAAVRLAHVRIGERGGYLVVRPHGVWAPRRHDWHETVGSGFADDLRTNTAVAFTTFFQLAVGEVEMVGYLNRRLLTIQTASTFCDGSGRAPHFVREYFYPTEE